MRQQLRRLKKRVLLNDILFFVILGFILNLTVMISNDSKMPVYFLNDEVEVPGDYILFDNFEDVNYPYLSDIFKISNLRFSIGDVLISGGILSAVLVLVFYKGGKDGFNVGGE